MRKIVYIMCFMTFFECIEAQISSKVEYFELQDVELLESPFRHAQELDKSYLLEMNADRLLSPFLREAGLAPKAESYTNWENSGLDGHIGGHYLSALSLMYASTGDEQIKERLDYMLSELKRCQDANGNGYIGGVPGGKQIWEEIAAGNIRAGSFDLNGKWVPLYNIHKTYAGLRDAWLYAEDERAKEMLVKMTDWAVNLVSGLSEEQIQDMLRSEYGGLNEIFADVAVITGDARYLKIARQFSHQSVLEPLLQHQDNLTGMHANTQIPKVLGFKRIADVEGSQDWSDAARFFWETVVENRSVCLGGNSAGEHFHPADDFSRMIKSIEGPETCNTYNMLRLSKMLFQTSRDKRYIDYYERALYNHILSSQHPEKGGFVYFTQMRPGHYRVYSQPHTSFWCCVGSGLENHAKYGEMIYASAGNELLVNLFIPSKLQWKEKNIQVVQETNFPDEPRTTLTINTTEAKKFRLSLRNPVWVKDGELKVLVNGKKVSYREDAGYISIERHWRNGDQLEMTMPMHVSVEQLPDNSDYFSFLYGPIVLAAKTSNDDLTGLFADDSRGGHIAHGRQIPLDDMPILTGEKNQLTSLLKPVVGKPLTFLLESLYSENNQSVMELIPFFRLHDSRYIIYWAQSTEQEVQALQEAIKIEEQERRKLDDITVDRVVCGEQQPESDHFIQSHESETGFNDDIHWRSAKGWFSYNMRNPDRKARYLHVNMLDENKIYNFEVLINDKSVAILDVKEKSRNNLISVSYLIPEDVSAETLIVKFVPLSGEITPKISEVRILSGNDVH